MRPLRYVPFLAIGLGVCTLLGVLRSPSAKARPALPTPPAELRQLLEAASDPAARQAVEHALAGFADPGREWLQSAVWLRCHVSGLTYQGEGVYLKAPGGRYRLEARTRRERAPGSTVLAVSDGLHRWQVTRAGTDKLEVRHLKVGEGPAWQLLAGVDPLMRSLHAHLSWVRHETKGAEVEVTGVWQPELRARLTPPELPWPANLPRACRVTLRDGWPGRVEWWGPATAGGGDGLLIEVEYRDPVWGRQLGDEECARLFSFDPGKAAVLDLTPPGKKY